MSWRYGGFAPYVSVAKRRQQAEKKVKALAKKGEKISPVVINGKKIADTFWGKAWCDNLESYMDFENRLPRGRTYVRNGSVVDLKILPGKVKALVSGSSLYRVEIGIDAVEKTRWQGVIKNCAGKIDSLVELLQGKLSTGVMETVTSRDKGLFPSPDHIEMRCSCPDYATMCKHVAATLYGVGSRLDFEPELLFLLRQVDHMELIANASVATATLKTSVATENILKSDDLASMFGIEMESEPVQSTTNKASVRVRKRMKAKKRKSSHIKSKSRGRK